MPHAKVPHEPLQSHEPLVAVTGSEDGESWEISDPFGDVFHGTGVGPVDILNRHTVVFDEENCCTSAIRVAGKETVQQWLVAQYASHADQYAVRTIVGVDVPVDSQMSQWECLVVTPISKPMATNHQDVTQNIRTVPRRESIFTQCGWVADDEMAYTT